MSDITHCLQAINFYERPEVITLAAGENVIYDYCIKQGAKNNLGMFFAERGAISFYLKVDHDLCYNFFLKYPKLIGFCPDTHLIWVKRFYEYVDFGIFGALYRTSKDNKTRLKKQVLNKKALYAKNNFISTVNSKINKEPKLRTHPFIKEWVEYNRFILEMINDEVKSVDGNGEGRNLDNLLALVK